MVRLENSLTPTSWREPRKGKVMNKDRAESVGESILSGSRRGEEAFLVSEGEAENNPHTSSQSGTHSDGWRVTSNGDGSVSASKEHVPE